MNFQDGTKCIKCSHCDKTFRHMCTYRRHIERVHEFTPEKRLKCDDCGKLFNHREGLATHVKKFHTPQVTTRDKLPEGHSAMDKALAWHTGSRGLNPDMTKGFSALILLGTPPPPLTLLMA